jgi:hypothetical protein
MKLSEAPLRLPAKTISLKTFFQQASFHLPILRKIR